MNTTRFEASIKASISQALTNELNPRNSCSFHFFKDKEALKQIINKILSKHKDKLTDWDIRNIIKKKTAEIQKKEPFLYPEKNATPNQIAAFAEVASSELAVYFNTDHKNKITIPILPNDQYLIDALNNKTFPGGSFSFDSKLKQLNLILFTDGPLIHDNDNPEFRRINNLFCTIIGTGILLDLFIIDFSESRFFDLENISLQHHEEFIQSKSIISDDSKALADETSLLILSKKETAEIFVTTLNKILNNSPSNLTYSIQWYCKSLSFVDIKSIFIYRYIGFEALSSIWTKSASENQAEKTSQSKLKHIVPVLLAKDICDIKNQQTTINEIIDIRNGLFHGEETKDEHIEYTRKLHRNYASLGELYKSLFIYTVNKI